MIPQRFRPLAGLISRVSIPWPLLGLAMVLTLLETGAALWIPMLTRDLVDQAATGVPRGLLMTLAGVLITQATISGFSLYLLASAGERMTADLRERVFRHLLLLPMGFHDEEESGELVSRTISDSTAVKSLLTEQLIGLVAGVVSMVGAVVILWFLDWRLTLVLFGSVLAGLLLVLPVVARLQTVGKAMQDEQASLSGRLTAILGEIRLVKSCCAEGFEQRRAGKLIGSLKALGLQEARVLSFLGPTVTLAMTGAMVVILGYGGARVGTGEIAVGTLIAFILYLFHVVMPMAQAFRFLRCFEQSGRSGRAFECLVGPGGRARAAGRCRAARRR